MTATPTPWIVKSFGDIAPGFASVAASDPLIIILLTAALIIGLALYVVRQARKAATK